MYNISHSQVFSLFSSCPCSDDKTMQHLGFLFLFFFCWPRYLVAFTIVYLHFYDIPSVLIWACWVQFNTLIHFALHLAFLLFVYPFVDALPYAHDWLQRRQDRQVLALVLKNYKQMTYF